MAAENLDSIVPFVEKWEQFRRTHKTGTIVQFAEWILEEARASPTDGKEWAREDIVLKNVNLQGEYPEIPSASGLAAYIVVRLFKALRFYFKPLLQQHDLSSIDDLFFLASLAWKPHISKKALCQTNMTDVPTGIDIIKRLIKSELVIEKENIDDKREKLLSLTQKGWEKIFSVFSGSEDVQDVFADLGVDDRKVMLRFLDRLNHYHTKVYLSKSS
jgi:DNA-binding MarR family transcriptional regulator